MSDATSYPLIEQIKKALFAPEARRHTRMVDLLVDAHDEVCTGTALGGFTWAGDQYLHSNSRTKYRVYPMLDWSLNEQMEAYLKDVKQTNLDRDQIGQVLFSLQSHVMNYGQGSEFEVQEQRDATPECLVRFVPKFAGIERRHNIQFFLRDERERRQYAKHLPKMELYAMTGLIY